MLMLAKKGTVGDLKMELEMLSGVKATHIAVVDVYKSRFHRIYSARDPLSHIMNTVNVSFLKHYLSVSQTEVNISSFTTFATG